MNSIIENQINFYEKKQQEVLKYALLDLKKAYENKDQEIFHSQWRKEKGYIPHGTRSKTLITIFGKLTYTRHRYRIWDKKRYRFVYLSDIVLGIKKYQRITTHLQIKILSLISKGKRYQDILDCFPASKINANTIINIIKKTKIKSLEELITKKSSPVKINQYLYINLDDTFLNLKEKNKKTQFRIRVVLFHNGYDLEKSNNNKKILKNPRIFTYITKKNNLINNKLFFQKIYQISNAFYSNIDQEKIIISGDGAPWIRSHYRNWKNSIYTLDKFHVIRKFKQLFNPNNPELKPIYEKIKHLFISGKYNQVMELLAKPWFQDKNKNLKLKKLKNYLFHNEKIKGISNQNHEFNIGCNIESAISHHIKNLLGYGSKAFSKNIFSKILTLHIANFNGIDTINLFKENFAKQLRDNF